MRGPLGWTRTVLTPGVRALGAALVALTLAIGCSSTGGQKTAAQARPAPEVAAQPSASSPSSAEPSVESAAPAGAGAAPAAASAEAVVSDATEEELEEPAEAPAGPLEQALSSCDAAQEYWRAGSFDAAFAALDRAYALMLRMPDNGDPVKAQEKADLRHLISRRVVEIYASRQTAVGELDRAIPVVSNERVEAEIRSFQAQERDFFVEAYRHSGRYRPMIIEELRKAGLPDQLSWLPLIESGFKVRALSVARALGLWQFISSTGYRYGLRRDSWIDERMDPEKATRGAIAYLTELHGMFGDWMTAIAAYNCGEQTVLRLINNQKINYLDQFWDLYAQLPRETARYVPRFLATLLIVQDPAKYGFDLSRPEEPVPSERVQVSRSVRLSELEKTLGLAAGVLEELNPELRHHATPKAPYDLRVPSQSAATVLASVANLPQWTPPVDEVGFHQVRGGDTLGRIAQHYGTSVERLMRLNGLRDPNRLSVGQMLKVPLRGPAPTGEVSTAAAAAAPAAASAAAPAGPTAESSVVKHTVRRGENLWQLADLYHTTVERIEQDNGLPSTRLHAGQVLTITTGTASGPAGAAPAAAGSGTYIVQSGDTPGSIARAFSVDLDRLLAANGLNRSSTIYPGQRLMIP